MADATLWLSQRPPEEAQADDDSTMHVAEVLRSRISVRSVNQLGETVLKTLTALEDMDTV